jgi:aminopeptidase N
MSGSMSARGCFRIALAVVLGVAGPLVAQDASVESGPDCETDKGKGGLCGHALAAIPLIEAGLPPKPPPEVLEAQSVTDVTHCFLDIDVKTTSPRSITGIATLDLASLTSGLTQFTLDLQSNMTVDAVTVNGVAATYTRPTNQIVISLGRTYDAGQSFQVKVTYHGTPRNRTDFFDSTQYFFTTHGGTTIASTLSQPFQANYWWPCKDNWEDISDKFTLDMWVTVPDTMLVASNGALQGTDTIAGGRLRFRWHEAYPIATYLVSFAATNYSKQSYVYSYAGGSMPVEFYIYPERVAESLPYLPDIVQAIATYSDPAVFGQYPFINEKYGIAQFAWCCGMEHQTITSQGAYTSERRNVHELSHQWWGDYITCKTWHDIWLNEGFATFAEALWQEKRPGGTYSAYLDSLNSNRPTTSGTGTVYRYDISSSAAIFDSTYAYDKGGWVTHMLRHVLGDAKFFEALAAYRALYGGGVADTDEFRSVCEQVSGLEPGALNWFFDEWIYNPGAPYYRYGWEQEQIAGRNWVRLHVEQYQKTVASSLPNAMKMPIDITVSTAGGSRTHVVWNDATGSGAGDTVTQWFLLPADGDVTGVQLDKDTWILRGDAASVAYVPGPPRLLSTLPTPGASVSGTVGVHTIELQFSEPVLYDPSCFTVTGSVSGYRVFTDTYDDIAHKITLSFSRPLSGGQTWTVRVLDNVRSQAGGDQLDGETASPSDPGALPSGDGLPGGTAVITFYVASLGDLDRDGDVDLTDFSAFQACFNGPNRPPADSGCAEEDFDGDADVDLSDFRILQMCFNGPNRPAACD